MTADLHPSSVLSDATIRELIDSGRIVIDPFDPSMIQPASVDIHLGHSFRVFHNHRIQSIDLGNPPRDLTEHVEVADDGEFVIHPGEFVLGRTHELVEIPDDIVCRIEGKALALDTEIPTPNGWTTMGEIQAGDRVFAPNGYQRTVIDATGVMEDRPCFEIRFSEGTTVVADAEHQWRVMDRYRWGPQLMTTRQIAEAGVKAGKRDYRFRIPEARAAEYTHKELPVDPYVLGVWIGDGTSTNANVTCYDPPIVREVELAGYAVRQVGDRQLFNVGGAEQARDPRTGQLTGGRAIVDVREVPSVPVRCIQIDDPRGLYVITRRYITTHNSSIGRLGLVVHATAGFVDPGFKGTLTLEIANFNSVPIVLRPKLPICQLSFMTLDRAAERPYGHPDLGSHYYGQVEATESRYRA